MERSGGEALRLSAVVPLYNEEALVEELIARLRATLAKVEGPCEIVAVDDRSADRTLEILRGLEAESGAPMRVLSLAENRGQLQATLAGMRAAEGALVVALDGDLQDPPELIVELVAAYERSEPDAVLAVKEGREYGGAAGLGSAVYGALLRLVSARALPPGAGSYCLMRQALAHKAAEVKLRHANLSAVLARLKPQVEAVPYTKQERGAGASRIGLVGLVREALGSLWLLLRGS